MQKQLQRAVEGENGAALQVTELPLPAVMLAQPDLQFHIGGAAAAEGFSGTGLSVAVFIHSSSRTMSRARLVNSARQPRAALYT